MRHRLRVREIPRPPIISINIVLVPRQQRRQVPANLNLVPLGGKDSADGEELGVGVVPLVVRDRVDIGALVGRVEAVLLGEAGGEVLEGLARDGGLAGEDEEAEGAVEGDLLLQMDDVGVDDAGDVGVPEEAAGDQGVRLGDDVGLGRVLGGPVELVGLVGYAVAGSERAGLLEGLDEFVFLGAGGGLLGRGGGDLVGRGGALGEELGVLVVERQKSLGDVLALGLVGLEDGLVGEAALDGVDLPGEVEGVEEGSVHALAGLGGVGVAGVAAKEDAVVEGVLVGNALADGVDRVPLDALPLDAVGLEDALGRGLDLLDGGRLAGVEVGVGGGGDLDVEADHVVLAGDDHDGAVLRVDGALHLDVGEVGLDDTVHDTPDVGDGVLVGDANLELVTDEGAGALAAEEVLGLDALLEGAVDVLELDADGVLGVGLLVRGEAGDGPGALDGGVVLLEVGDESTLDQTLVEEGGEGVSGVDEVGARGPGAGTGNALAAGGRVPESNLVDTSGLVGHDGRLEAHVAEEIEGTGLDAIGTASGGRLRSVVDVLDLVTPSRQAGREHQADGTGTNNDCLGC